MDQQDILERFDRLDMEAFATIDTPHIYKMVIVGGSGLVLLGVIARASALNEKRYQDFLYDYSEYVRSYGPDEAADV